MPDAVIHLCLPRQYEFDGVVFEMSTPWFPWPLKKDGDPKKLMPGRVFFRRIGPWLKMTREEQEKFRIGGGCVCFEVPTSVHSTV